MAELSREQIATLAQTMALEAVKNLMENFTELPDTNELAEPQRGQLFASLNHVICNFEHSIRSDNRLANNEQIQMSRTVDDVILSAKELEFDIPMDSAKYVLEQVFDRWNRLDNSTNDHIDELVSDCFDEHQAELAEESE